MIFIIEKRKNQRLGDVFSRLLDKMGDIESAIISQNRSSTSTPSASSEPLLNNLVLCLRDDVASLDEKIDDKISNLETDVKDLGKDITDIKINVAAIMTKQAESDRKSEQKSSTDRWRWSIAVAIGAFVASITKLFLSLP